MTRILYAILIVMMAAPCWGFGFGSGGSSGTPLATTERAGKVKPDGTTLTVGGDGTLSALTAVRVLAQSAVPVSVGGTLAEITLASYTLPGNLMGLNGAVRVTGLWSHTNSANTKTLRAKLATQAFAAKAQTTTSSYHHQFVVRNRNSVTSQVGMQSGITGGFGSDGSGVQFTAFNTAVDQTITFTAQTTLETGFTPTTTNMSGNGSVVTVIQTAHGLNTGEYIKAAGSSTSGYNIDPVTITRIDANTFTYPATGTGTPTTAPLIQRYSVITLEGYTIELLPGAN